MIEKFNVDCLAPWASIAHYFCYVKEPSVLGRLQLFFLSTLALNVNEAGEKRKYTPWLNADTVL